MEQANDQTVYDVDFRSTRNCDRIANMAPGEKAEILVRPDGQPGAEPTRAKACRSADGSEFHVTLDKGAEPRTHTWM
jgi:hypothetical protein